MSLECAKPALNMGFLIGFIGFAEDDLCSEQVETIFKLFGNELWTVVQDIQEG
ncbi:hypothetical protein D3C76_1158120 [compost metagenome]